MGLLKTRILYLSLQIVTSPTPRGENDVDKKIKREERMILNEYRANRRKKKKTYNMMGDFHAQVF